MIVIMKASVRTRVQEPSRSRQAGGAPDGEPPGDVRLHRQVGPDGGRGPAARTPCPASGRRSARTGRTCRACRGRRARPGGRRRRRARPGSTAGSGRSRRRRSEFTACRSVTRPGSVARLVAQQQPGEAERVDAALDVRSPAGLESASASVVTSVEARPSAARKATEPRPVGRSPIAASRVRAASVSANSWSRVGSGGVLRPSSLPSRLTRRDSVAEISASWSSRFSSGGCVENNDERVKPGATAGAKKNAL